jgi:hypothetical protein
VAADVESREREPVLRVNDPGLGRLQADDRLAAQSALPELFQHLAGGIQVNGGTDARGDRAVREELPDPCPWGEIRGFALEEWLRAVICRLANQPSSAAKMDETRRPPGRMTSASRRMASGPLDRSRTASTPSG